MRDESPSIDPILSNDEREELRHLDYLSSRIQDLLARGLLTPDAHAAIAADRDHRRAAIERHGRFEAAMGRARSLAATRPSEALAWADRARESDPSESEAWVKAIDLLWAMERDDEAVAICAEAVGRFPFLGTKHQRLVDLLPGRAEARRIKEERARRERELEDRLAEARQALERQVDEEAAALGRAVLTESPGRIAALRIVALALHRLGRLEEALGYFRELERLQPSNRQWSEWVRSLEIRRRFGGLGEKAAGGLWTDAEGPAARLDAPPRWSWSSFAAEFLEEHWQKLILCLAVLLIVVSSTVGAHLLLGELLWQPAGKCALALVWTILFAALGGGLIRWGAERAGQMMLVATLIVVPIHFMLVGEFRLVTVPTTVGLVVAAVDGLALVGLVRVVAGMLAPPGQARFLSSAILLLSVGSVATARGSPVGWGWQFAAFQSPALVYLGSVWVLGRRRWGETDEEHRSFAVLALGLLGFAFLACTIRIGGYALQLEPALYAVPVMLGAIATVNAARRLVPYESDVRRIAGIRFAGYVLSGLAFALAMAPPAPSALFSGNAVAASLLGFGLYFAALRRERHPAFLYLSLAALVAARVGAHYFLAERIRLIIDVLRQWLGYRDHLPWAYLALVGLGLNPALMVLSAWFRRGWKDERLARHCHYIGLPLAVVACLWSCGEPEAATIILSGYAVLFGLAIWLYGMPTLAYGSILSICGAAYFGSTLVSGLTLADRALIAVVLAWGFLGVGQWLRRTGFSAPWLNATRALTVIGWLVASGFIAIMTTHSPGAAGAFLLVGGLAMIGVLERPRPATAGIVLVSFVELTFCVLSLLTGGGPHSPGVYAVLLVGDGLALLAVALVLGRSGSSLAGAAEVFLATTLRFAIGLTYIADYVAFTEGRGWLPGVAWLLGAPALIGTTLRIRDLSLVYLGIAQLVMGWLALSIQAMGFSEPGMVVGGLALGASVLSGLLWLTGVASRRRNVSDFYVAPCLNGCLALTAMVLACSVGSRLMIRDAYPFATLALLLSGVVTLLLSATWRRSELTYPAIVHVVVATYIVLFSVGRNDPGMAFVLGLAAVIEAIVFWVIGFGCERIASGRLAPYARPLYHATVAMTGLGILLSDQSAVVLMLASVAFLLTVRSWPRLEWLYAAVACLGAACYFRWIWAMSPGGVLAAVMAWAFGLWVVGVLVQRSRAGICERLGLAPLDYEKPLFHSSMAAGAIALAVRGSLSASGGVSWTAYAWLPISLSMLALLMPRAYPRREWIHASLALLVWGMVSAVSPSLTSMAAVATAGMAMALGFLLAEQALRGREHDLCDRLGVLDVGYLGVVRAWSASIFGMMLVLVIAIVVLGVADAYGARPWSDRPAEWWLLLGSLSLAALYLVVTVSDPEGWAFVGQEGALNFLHAIVVLGLWWLATAGSPLARWLPQARDYYPIATAVAALSALYLGRRFSDPETWHEPALLGDVRSETSRRALAFQSGFLAVLAIAMTGFIVSVTTVVAMVLGSLALALAGFVGGWPESAAISGLAWVGAWSILGSLLARLLGFLPGDQRATWSSWGAMFAAFTLWRWGGVLRSGGPIAKGGIITADATVASGLRRFAVAVEGVAAGAVLVASAWTLGLGLQGPGSEPWVTFAGVGVLIASSILQILLVPRWRSEGPVYVAQILMVGAYLRFRLGFPISSAADAAVLTLLGYLDLAIAEALDRLDRSGHYIRPMRYTSLALPVLPLLSLFLAPRLDDVSLFYLAAAATFYATACGRLRWKTLGYTAAVFADATLWLAWSRMGWRLAEYPQLYLVPVGISAILFAEVNRELGRQAVNAIRTVGLIVIYASLAMPIWQHASFGAWVTLLLASLLGIFAGIGLRLQTFLWLGLTTFVLDLVYEMGRVGLDYAMAKWAIMLALGIALVIFVALNEKKRILSQMLDYYAQVRTWE